MQMGSSHGVAYPKLTAPILLRKDILARAFHAGSHQHHETIKFPLNIFCAGEQHPIRKSCDRESFLLCLAKALESVGPVEQSLSLPSVEA
jgi:hypothetical protein